MGSAHRETLATLEGPLAASIEESYQFGVAEEMARAGKKSLGADSVLYTVSNELIKHLSNLPKVLVHTFYECLDPEAGRLYRGDEAFGWLLQGRGMSLHFNEADLECPDP